MLDIKGIPSGLLIKLDRVGQGIMLIYGFTAVYPTFFGSTATFLLPFFSCKHGFITLDNAFHLQSLGSTVTVLISGDSIKIINNGSLSGEKGEIIEYGRIMKHRSTGRWIIATKPEDEFAAEVGGCSEGPRVIDFKNKKWWTC